ncbi:MAG: helix-turn-helix transcriptional regulator, partial [bacterium]|nr:helix-turn-helix transcriptional regulator [bacterium]
FKTGAIIKELVRIPSSGNKPTAIDLQIISKIDQLSSEYTAGDTAKKLTEEGDIHPTLGKFDTNAIVYLLRRFNIQTRYSRLRAKGYVSQEELAERCGVGAQTIQRWRRHGWINAKRYNDQPEYLYEPKFNALPAHIAQQYSSLLTAN